MSYYNLKTVYAECEDCDQEKCCLLLDGSVDNNGMINGTLNKKLTENLKFKVDLDALMGTTYYHRLCS